MDANRFDLLVKSFSAAGTRRRVVGLLTALPFAGGLVALLEEEGDAAGRRKRRKKRHKHRQGDRKDNRKGKRKGKHKGKHKGKKKCTKAGLAPTKGKPCCQGLSPDGTGACAAPVPPVPPVPPVCGDVCASGCAFTSVQAAIDAASPGATITICAGTYVENIDVTEDVTLIGAGDGPNPAVDTILDGNNVLPAVVTVPAGRTVTLTSLRITNGAGGGVDTEGDLTMTNCTVADNAKSTEGGGISNNAGTLTMTDCTVTGNSTTSATGSGGISSQSALTMTGCTVSGNTAPALGGGGGMRVTTGATSGDATLTNCVVGPDNEAGIGGGIFILGGPTLTLDGTTVSGNRAVAVDAGTGGGVRVDFSTTLRLLNGSRVSDNTATLNGGGIYNFAGTVELDASFVGPVNIATDNGGGIFNDSIPPASLVGAVTLSNSSSVTGNDADGNGGGIFNRGTVDCSGGTVTGNTAGAPPMANNCIDDGAGTGCGVCPT